MRKSFISAFGGWGCILLLCAWCAAATTAQEAAKVDPFMGDYAGKYQATGLQELRAWAKVVPAGDSTYRVIIRAEGFDKDHWSPAIEVPGRRFGAEVPLFGQSMGVAWDGAIKDDALELRMSYRNNAYGGKFTLKKADKPSPTLGEKPPAGAAVLLAYDGKTPPALDAWTGGKWKPLPDGSVEVVPGQGEIRSKEAFGDVRLHVEFMTAYQPDAHGQERSNSGVFLMAEYEVQVLDSFGVPPTAGDAGAIYSLVAPRFNASLPPLTWQTYDIEFRAPRFGDDGKVVKNPVITVALNGEEVVKKTEIANNTLTHKPHTAKTGPITLQDHKCKVRYRNVWVEELK